MNLFLDDSSCREHLFPFTNTRHAADIRIGILTIREKWELITGLVVVTNEAYKNKSTITIPANIIPTTGTASSIIKAAIQKSKEEYSDLNSQGHVHYLCIGKKAVDIFKSRKLPVDK